MITPEFESLMNQNDLDIYSAGKLMDFLVSTQSTDSMKAAFLAAMFVKGVRPDELVGFARALRAKASISRVSGLTDIVGTGGDHKNTVNVSTAAAIVCASLGIKIGKHGNRASTGKHGSADFLEKIGYRFTMTFNEIISNLGKNNFVFIMANGYNRYFMEFSVVRRKLGFSSVLNYLGPITNPLDPDVMVIGCTNRDIGKIYAEVLRRSGKSGCVVFAEDGMDEVSPLSPTTLLMHDESTFELTVYPEELDLQDIKEEDISSPDPQKIFSKTLDGIKGTDRKVAKFIAANASPALLLNNAGADLAECYEKALESIERGNAYAKLKSLVENNAQH